MTEGFKIEDLAEEETVETILVELDNLIEVLEDEEGIEAGRMMMMILHQKETEGGQMMMILHQEEIEGGQMIMILHQEEIDSGQMMMTLLQGVGHLVDRHKEGLLLIVIVMMTFKELGSVLEINFFSSWQVP